MRLRPATTIDAMRPSCFPAGTKVWFPHCPANPPMTETAFTLDIDFALLADPLMFLDADHARIAAGCDILQGLLKDLRRHGSSQQATMLHRMLSRDLPDHIADEEDLFRLLEENDVTDDGLRNIIRLLRTEHEADHEATVVIAAELQRFVSGADMQAPAKFFVLATSYAENKRRHLTWENHTVIPAARRIFGRPELDRLGDQMRQRRNGRRG